MNRWIDLDELRRDIAAEAKARAVAAGLEGVKIRVQIAQPNKRGDRIIDVEVTHTPPSWAESRAIDVGDAVVYVDRCYEAVASGTALIKAPR